MESGFPVALGAAGIQKTQGEANALTSGQEAEERKRRKGLVPLCILPRISLPQTEGPTPSQVPLVPNHAIPGKYLLTQGPSNRCDQCHAKLISAWRRCASHRESAHYGSRGWLMISSSLDCMSRKAL